MGNVPDFDVTRSQQNSIPDVVREFANKLIVSRSPLAAGASASPDRLQRWYERQVADIRVMAMTAAKTFARRDGQDPEKFASPEMVARFASLLAQDIASASFELHRWDLSVVQALSVGG